MAGFTPPLTSTDPDHRNTGAAMHAGSQSRIEPEADGVGGAQRTPHVNPAYEQFQREYAERYAQYEQPSMPRRRVPRLAYMAMVFVVGAGVGLGSAWWISQPSGTPKAHSIPGISSSKPLLPPLAEARKLSTPGQGAVARGISRSELPYDGAPPDNAGDQPAATPPLASASPRNPAPPLISSGSSIDDAEQPLANAAPASPARQETPKPPPVKPASPPAKEAPLAMVGKEVTQPAKSESRPAVAPPKRRIESKVANDLEIERIRRQADEELKKKTEAKRRIEEARAAKKPNATSGSSTANTATARSGGERILPKIHGTQVMLARCEQAANIFLREQCKWKLCNGMWGRNGCPSYSKPAGNNAY